MRLGWYGEGEISWPRLRLRNSASSKAGSREPAREMERPEARCPLPAGVAARTADPPRDPAPTPGVSRGPSATDPPRDPAAPATSTDGCRDRRPYRSTLESRLGGLL